jgi:hypothetical protein
MAKANLASMSVDTLLKLRDDIEKVLTSRTQDLRDQLARLGHEIGPRSRGSLLKGRKVERSQSNIAISRATHGRVEEHRPMKQLIQAIAGRFGYFIIKRATLDELTQRACKGARPHL